MVSWRRGQKTRKLRKKPCGLLEMRVKNKKSEKKPCGLLMMRAKIRKIEKKALRSVNDEGKNQEK